MVSITGVCDRKVVGGKMFRVRVDMDIEGERPRMIDLRLLGDFFLHPEESLEGLEAAIRDAYNEGAGVPEAISEFLTDQGAVVFGGSPEDISGAVADAVTDAVSGR